MSSFKDFCYKDFYKMELVSLCYDNEEVGKRLEFKTRTFIVPEELYPFGLNISDYEYGETQRSYNYWVNKVSPSIAVFALDMDLSLAKTVLKVIDNGTNIDKNSRNLEGVLVDNTISFGNEGEYPIKPVEVTSLEDFVENFNNILKRWNAYKSYVRFVSKVFIRKGLTLQNLKDAQGMGWEAEYMEDVCLQATRLLKRILEVEGSVYSFKGIKINPDYLTIETRLYKFNTLVENVSEEILNDLNKLCKQYCQNRPYLYSTSELKIKVTVNRDNNDRLSWCFIFC